MNLYPYTDFHELNDDWIIGHIKKNEKDIAALQNTIVNLNFEFDRKADKATTYTKSEVNTLLSGKVDNATLTNYYDKTETNNLLANKANISDLPDMSNYYNKTATDNLLAAKADKASTLAGYGINNAYTQTEVDLMITSLQTQITQKDVLTTTVSITIPANQSGRTITSDEIFDSNYKLVSLNVLYTNDLYFFTENKTPVFSYGEATRKIVISVKESAIGDSAARTIQFNVSYKRA